MTKIALPATCMTFGLILLATQFFGTTSIAGYSHDIVAHKINRASDILKGAPMDSAAVQQEIQQLSKTWNTAWLENDSATVDRLMAADYVYVAPNGQILDRRAILEVILSPTYKIHHGTWTELQIQVFSNDAAVIIDRWTGTGTLNGNTFTDDNRCARLCLRRNGAWQIAFEQASPVKP